MTNEFDIEKYRKENPMDYIKAIELITESHNKDEVFDILYKITRLHIPNILYKYFSLTKNNNLNESKLDTLEKQKVYLADSKDFNDPFDNKAFFYKNDDLKQYKELIPHNGRILDDIFYSSRTTSFTKVGINSMPMWAHYSNNHHGFCVSYDMKNPKNIQLSGCTFPIQYLDERIDITDIMVKQIGMILKEKEKQIKEGKKRIVINDLTLAYIIPLIKNIKHNMWSYEQEFRCTAMSSDIGMPFMSASPSAIYIGLKCSRIFIDKLLSIAKKINIPVYKMVFNEFEDKYKLNTLNIN